MLVIRCYEMSLTIFYSSYDSRADMIRDQANGPDYLQNAYHTALLRQFFIGGDDSKLTNNNKSNDLDSSMNRKMKLWTERRSVADISLDESNGHHVHGSSVHGTNIWGTLQKQMETKKLSKMNSLGSSPNLAALSLNQSSHV